MLKDYDIQSADAPQVEPEASYWFRCLNLRNISFEEVKKEIDLLLPPYETNTVNLNADIDKLKTFYKNRLAAFDQNQLSLFLKDSLYTSEPPAGAVVSRTANGKPRQPLIQNGLELASLFENETPGLWHRHVLNVLIDPRVGKGLGQTLSPPLQALIWNALDAAISSALMTAWHYKWLATKKKTVARRQRPVEYDSSLTVLYDFEVDANTKILKRTKKKTMPSLFPGTPRHPAYTSGHSTYSGAASRILDCLFGQRKDQNGNLLSGEFTKLAENIGAARLWGGVHWSDDDTTGRLIGEAVASVIIRRLNESNIYDLLQGETQVPARQDQENDAKEFARNCKNDEIADFCQGLPVRKQGLQNLQG